jgi:hypothetical protein
MYVKETVAAFVKPGTAGVLTRTCPGTAGVPTRTLIGARNVREDPCDAPLGLASIGNFAGGSTTGHGHLTTIESAGQST